MGRNGLHEKEYVWESERKFEKLYSKLKFVFKLNIKQLKYNFQNKKDQKILLNIVYIMVLVYISKFFLFKYINDEGLNLDRLCKLNI